MLALDAKRSISVNTARRCSEQDQSRTETIKTEINLKFLADSIIITLGRNHLALKFICESWLSAHEVLAMYKNNERVKPTLTDVSNCGKTQSLGQCTYCYV